MSQYCNVPHSSHDLQVTDAFCSRTDMPKNKSKREIAKAATGDTDDDFDRMLAEVTTADMQLPVDVPASTVTTASITSSSSSSSSSSEGAGASLRGLQVSENAIVAACKRGDIAQLRRWGRQGVRVKSADTLIYSILEVMSIDILRCLVEDLGTDINGARLTDRVTPLCAAAYIGNLPFVQCLTQELGADVNQGIRDGGTPLYIAAYMGHMALMRCLVKELGADVNQSVSDGGTPLYIAAENGHLAVVQLLVTELGADVNRAKPNGANPLHIAAQQGHLAVVRYLVKESDADVNKARQNGVTPLMAAATSMHEDVVTFLIKYGANVQVTAPVFGTAADLFKSVGAAPEQTRYLVARTHCTNTGCVGAGIKKCAGCLKVFYCKRECQLAHWPAHKAECRRSAEVTAGKGN
jgi:hypothetical protein